LGIVKQIIYAAYGANLCKERFMVYIDGGEYNRKQYKGCRDKTEPAECGWMYVPQRLYFAKESDNWGKSGVAFLDYKKESNSDYYTLVRLWKISEEQFEDIHKQEGKSWYNIIGNKNNNRMLDE